MIPLRRLIAPAYDFGKELAEEVRQEKADRICPAHAETPSEDVWNVPELDGGLLHTLARPLVDGVGIVEYAGDRRYGNAGS